MVETNLAGETTEAETVGQQSRCIRPVDGNWIPKGAHPSGQWTTI